MAIFDDILKTATAEDRAVLEKYPQLKTSITELEDLKPKYEKASDLNTRWHQWVDAHWVESESKTKQQIEAENRAKAAEDRAALLENLGGSDMTFEEIEQQIKAKGYAPVAEIESKMDAKYKPLIEKAVNQESLDRAIANTLAGVQVSYAKTEDLAHRYEKDFGKPMDRSAFLEHAWKQNPRKPEDFNDAYTSFVAKDREEKLAAEQKTRDAETTKKLEEAKLAGIEEGKKQASMSRTGRMPTDQGSPSEMGHMQRRVEESRKPKEGTPLDNPDVKLGDGVAELMYQKYLNDQGGGSVQ